MIRQILNILNEKRNEIVTKMKREKFEFNVRRYNIEFEITKTKITRLNLNNCDCYIF